MVDHTLSMEYLRGLDQKPRVHGNGFIQLDMGADRRLHVWGHPDIPRQKNPTPIHDHKFSFRSEIIVGRLINVWYSEPYAVPGGPFHVYEAVDRHGEDTELVCKYPQPHSTHVIACQNVFAGGNYRMDAFDFHETLAPEPTVTVMLKEGPRYVEGNPRVLVPVNKRPSNEFDRYAHSEEMLWQIIEDVLGLAIR